MKVAGASRNYNERNNYTAVRNRGPYFREAVEFFNSNARMEEDQAHQIVLKFWRMEPVSRKSCSHGKANYLLRTEPSYNKQKG